MFLELVKSKHVPIKDRIKFMIELHAKLGKQITKEQAKKLVNEDKLPTQVMYANEDYLVQVYDKELADEMVHTDDLKGKCTWLSIRRQIKNFICGKTREAIQLYPSEDRLIDTANQYHLIVFPQDVLIPFGWHVGRTVSSESVEVNNSKTKQRLKNVL